MVSVNDQERDERADAFLHTITAGIAGFGPAIGATRACPDCRRPQHYTGTELGWCHDAATGTWDCADPRKAGA